MTDIEQQARKEAEALLALVKKYRPITDECPRCDGMGCSGPCPPHYWEAPMLEGFATFISERSKPSLMVGFSEEEIERMVLLADSEAFRRDDGELMMSGFGNGYFAGLRLANTRAVSIDRLVEVVTEWLTHDGREPDNTRQQPMPMSDLRERLMKIMP